MNKVKIGVLGGYQRFSVIDQIITSPDAESVSVCGKYQPLLEKIQMYAYGQSRQSGMEEAAIHLFCGLSLEAIINSVSTAAQNDSCSIKPYS